jgi:IQ motif/SEC7 domain-containing protein
VSQGRVNVCGMFSDYQHGIRLGTNIDGKVLITFNARNEHDRSKFVEDLKEAILEMNEMEALRIEEELQKQKIGQNHGHGYNRHSNDSGMVDIELLKPNDPGYNRLSAPECGLKKNGALSNSLIDLNEGAAGRRGSGGSLDSGMASTGSNSSASREEALHGRSIRAQSSTSKFAGLFGKKTKDTSKSSLKHVTSDSSEV